MDVHVRDLRYFVAVAEELHFTRAAERLFISQPALSKQIRTLERNLGTPLFDRDAREVRLTDAGSALLPHARTILSRWEAGFDAIEAVRARQRATLTVGMSTSPGRDGLLPAIRSRFNDQLPGVELRLRQVGWEDPTAGLSDGSSDVAFVWLPLPDQDRYRFDVIVEEPCMVALPESDPRAAAATIAFHDLLDEPFLALPKQAGPLRDYWLATEHRDGSQPLIGAEINSPDETYESLVGGLGICLLASGNAPSLTRGGVVTTPVSGLPPCRLAIAWRDDHETEAVLAYAKAGIAARDSRRGAVTRMDVQRDDRCRAERGTGRRPRGVCRG